MSTPKTAGALVATTGIDPQAPGVAQMVERLSKALGTVAAAAEVTERYLTLDPVPTAAVRTTVRALADEARQVSAMYRALRLLVERRGCWSSWHDALPPICRPGDFPGAFLIPGPGGISFAIGGFIKTLVFTDSKAEGREAVFIPQGTRPDSVGGTHRHRSRRPR